MILQRFNLFVLCMVLGMLTLSVHAQKNKPAARKPLPPKMKTAAKTGEKDSIVLAVIGRLITQDQNKTVSKIVVNLYLENTLQTTQNISSTTDFWFVLNKNCRYTIEILAKGYQDKLISIDTKIPAGVNPSPPFQFEFDTELTPQIKGDDFMLDFPLVLISYNTESDRFEYNKAYTERMKKEYDRLQKMHDDIQKKKKAKGK